MSALLMGKALVQKNPKVHNNLWKPEVIKPFPSQFLKNSPHLSEVFSMETAKTLPTALNLFCNSSTTVVASPLSGSLVLKSSFATQGDRDGGRERRRDVPILKVDGVDAKKIEFQEPEISPKGNMFVPISYNGKQLRLETTTLRAPFGLKKFTSSTGREEGILNLAFESNEADPSQKMLKLLKGFEEQVVQTAVARASTWFPEWADKSAEKIQSSFRSALRPPRDPKFSPLWKLKVNLNVRPTEFYYNGDKIPIEEVVNNTRLTSIVELRGLWVMPDAFGTTWSILQARIDEVPAPRSRRNSTEDTNESQ